MKLGNDLLAKKFDEIDTKIDTLIERCKLFQVENQELKNKLHKLETELEKTSLKEKQYLDQEGTVQSKVDGLLEKLNTFASE